MNINKYLRSTRREDGRSPRIYCKDGFNLSVQATKYAYCQPRNAKGPWDTVEVGFPSDSPSFEMLKYIEIEGDDPKESVYSYVPIEVVDALITEHGGFKND